MAKINLVKKRFQQDDSSNCIYDKEKEQIFTAERLELEF